MKHSKSNLLLGIRAITLAYAILIAGVVVSANAGWFASAFEWARSYANDKWVNFLMVGMLSCLTNLSLRNARLGRIQWGTTGLLLLSLVEEFSQLTLANRTFDWVDMACNLAGILVFGGLAWLLGGVLGIRRNKQGRDPGSSIHD